MFAKKKKKISQVWKDVVVVDSRVILRSYTLSLTLKVFLIVETRVKVGVTKENKLNLYLKKTRY